jgi:hypothetical protein
VEAGLSKRLIKAEWEARLNEPEWK